MKKWKLKLLLLSLLLGALYCTEQHYSFLRLRSLEIVPHGSIPDTAVWRFVPARAEIFWPLLAFGGNDFERTIESFYPVNAKLRATGWGRYGLEVNALEVLTRVEWNSRTWLVSKNGRMWLANLPANTELRIKAEQGPLLVWDKPMPVPMDTEGARGDISPSSLPLRKISQWLETIEEVGWKGDVKKIIATKKDGRLVVSLVMVTNNRVVGEITLKENTADWAQLALAFRQKGIYPRAEDERGTIEINATFIDKKFTVKTRAQ